MFSTRLEDRVREQSLLGSYSSAAPSLKLCHGHQMLQCVGKAAPSGQTHFPLNCAWFILPAPQVSQCHQGEIANVNYMSLLCFHCSSSSCLPSVSQQTLISPFDFLLFTGSSMRRVHSSTSLFSLG